VTSVDPAVRRRVGATWAFRAVGEREAATRFRRLEGELRATGADPVVVQMAADAAEDETRHERLCTELAAAYGRKVRDDVPPAIPVGAPGLSSSDRVLMEVVSFCCVAESLAATALATIQDVTTVSDVGDVVHEILRDEISHGRLGWAHLAAERKKGRGEFLSRHLEGMLIAGIPEDLFVPDLEPENDVLLAHGELSRGRRMDIFVSTLNEVIFPGLVSLGIDTAGGTAWLARCLRDNAGGCVSK
jgi:hypothetical protein